MKAQGIHMSGNRKLLRWWFKSSAKVLWCKLLEVVVVKPWDATSTRTKRWTTYSIRYDLSFLINRFNGLKYVYKLCICMTLCLHLGFLPKVISPTVVNHYIHFLEFLDREQAEYSLLCPVWTLPYCMNWIAVRRSSDQLSEGQEGSSV